MITRHPLAHTMNRIRQCDIVLPFVELTSALKQDTIRGLAAAIPSTGARSRLPLTP